MTDVVLATLATSVSMGQQQYQAHLKRHLSLVAPDLNVREVRVRSMRSDLVGEARLPLTAVGRFCLTLQHYTARATYGPAGLVHRCDLRLPAAATEIVTVHDVAPLRFSDEGTIPPTAAPSLRQAGAVICPSQFAATEMTSMVGIDSAIVIYNGLDPDVWKTTSHAPELLAGVPDRFIMHSGGASDRKNLSSLAQAWGKVAPVHSDVGLVLCGPADPRRDRLFAGMPRVHRLGWVPRDQHLALMRAATLVVVPSTYEGFGFPALEAMAKGTAVLASATAALPEICGDAALLVKPDGYGIASGIMRLLTEPDVRRKFEHRGQMRARYFTWTRCASEHASVYRRVLGQRLDRKR